MEYNVSVQVESFIGEHEYFGINSKSYSRTQIIRSNALKTLYKLQFWK